MFHNENLNVLLSGPGLMGKQHAKLIKAHPDCKLSAIVAPSSECNKQVARTNGATFYSSLEEALRLEHFDAAIISSPNEFHFAQASACVRAGIPVLVEKPITDDVADAHRLVRLAESSKVPVLVGHHRTYNPLLAAAERFLRSPMFGRPVALQGSALFYKPGSYFKEGPWRAVLGGGPILINLIHEIGLMRFFFGEIRRVFAVAGRDVRNLEVEDTVAISLAFANGALGTFLLSDAAASSKSWEMTTGENSAYPHFPTEDCYHFAGTNGSLDFPSLEARYYAAGSEPSWWHRFEKSKIPLAQGDPLTLQMNHLVEVVRGQATPRVSVRDGYLNMLVARAITQSVATERAVDVERTVE
jgi:predicted dehydrogenase